MCNWRHGKGTILLQISSELHNYGHGALDLKLRTPSHHQVSMGTLICSPLLHYKRIPIHTPSFILHHEVTWWLDVYNLCRPLAG